jgi:hypothetical protein
VTVRELIHRLSVFHPQVEVTAYWDTLPDFTVHDVVEVEGRAVIDCDDRRGPTLRGLESDDNED